MQLPMKHFLSYIKASIFCLSQEMCTENHSSVELPNNNCFHFQLNNFHFWRQKEIENEIQSNSYQYFHFFKCFPVFCSTIPLKTSENILFSDVFRGLRKCCRKLERLEINGLVSFTTQPALSCSKLTLETLEQGAKYAQS